MIKTPFNWAGNKSDYMDYVNTIINGKSYERVTDMFMGSGAVLLNIGCKAEQFIGNDILKLMPEILDYMSTYKLNVLEKEVTEIDAEWGFSLSEHYYTFRDYWNNRYLNGKVDKQYIIETVMLLKMCNNSMIRFNGKGEMNQGFRGISKSKVRGLGKFFSDRSFKTIALELNNLNDMLLKKNYRFYNKDFRQLITELGVGDLKNELILLDPPYVLSNTTLYGETYKEEEEKFLLDFIENIQGDFILFNYLSNCEVDHTPLQDLIDKNNYKVSILSVKGRLKNIANTNVMQEVIVTNIK